MGGRRDQRERGEPNFSMDPAPTETQFVALLSVLGRNLRNGRDEFQFDDSD